MNPLLVAEGLSKFYGARIGCRNVSFALEPAKCLPSWVNPAPARPRS